MRNTPSSDATAHHPHGCHANGTTAAPDPEHSPWYQDLTAGMEAWELWEVLGTAERLEVILTHFDPLDWFKPQYLPIVASGRHTPPGKWGQVRARFKAIGGDPFDLQREVDKLLQAQAAPAPHQDSPHGLITQCADDITPQATAWLWEPYIALGTLCLLDGDPGTGKSLSTLQLAANVSRGWPFPDQLGTPTIGGGDPGTVLIMTREDSLSRTVRPRLDACGADVARVHVGVNYPDAEGKPQPFTLQHLPQLEVTLAKLRPRLVILDPIQSFLGAIDMHRSNQTRPLLDALVQLAEQYQCAIVAVRHPGKPGEGIGKALHRGLGSVDIIGAARTGLFIEQYPGDDTRAMVAQTKSNLGPLGRTIIFSKKEGRFAWDRVTRLNAEDMAGSGRGPHHRDFLEAFLWLEHRLEGNLAWSSKDILTEASDQEITRGTLLRAKKTLQVVSKKSSEEDGGWTWRLPPLSLSTPLSSTSSTTSVSSTTSNSSDRTKTYGKPHEEFEGGEEVEEVEEFEETQVVDAPPCVACGRMELCADCRDVGRH